MGCQAPKTGAVGWFLNGIALYGWSDGYSYNGVNLWHSIAAEFNKYDFDICAGESTIDSPYHRKFYGYFSSD